METISQKRCRFTHALAVLLLYAKQQNIDVAVDQVKRTQAEANANAAAGVGISNSLHTLGLAADLLVYVSGLYQRDGSLYAKLGAFWKSLGQEFTWGGDFKKPDPGHFSLTHNGVR